MCGRYVRAHAPVDYVTPLMFNPDFHFRMAPDDSPSWNVAPGTRQPVIYPDGETRRVHWGYRPPWAVAKKIPQVINARVEGAASKPFFRAMWKTGRVVVPADGWYEWILADDGKKQPFFIRPKGGQPLFMAGLTNVRPGIEPRDGDGFVIVTAAADAGLVDVHDRRPVAFTAADAREWVDTETSSELASHLAHNAALPADAFEWFPVSRDVNRAGNDGSHLVEPVDHER